MSADQRDGEIHSLRLNVADANAEFRRLTDRCRAALGADAPESLAECIEELVRRLDL
jgi:hypothetical protein